MASLLVFPDRLRDLVRLLLGGSGLGDRLLRREELLERNVFGCSIFGPKSCVSKVLIDGMRRGIRELVLLEYAVSSAVVVVVVTVAEVDVVGVAIGIKLLLAGFESTLVLKSQIANFRHHQFT